MSAKPARVEKLVIKLKELLPPMEMLSTIVCAIVIKLSASVTLASPSVHSGHYHTRSHSYTHSTHRTHTLTHTVTDSRAPVVCRYV